MKLTKSSGKVEKVEFDMTPMIDVCFQLIIFFMLTLKMLAPEGDFNIKMPLAAPSQGVPDPSQLPPIKVRLSSGFDGQLAGIQFGQRNVSDFKDLHMQIRKAIGDNPSPSAAAATEVEFDCDYTLRYEYVIKAITAVSGYRVGDNVIKLVEKIKFAPVRAK